MALNGWVFEQYRPDLYRYLKSFVCSNAVFILDILGDEAVILALKAVYWMFAAIKINHKEFWVVQSVEERWVLFVPKPRFHADTARGIYESAMANFDEEFSCQSLLGVPVSSIEELIYHNKRFCLFFMLRPLEKFIVCQYIFCYNKNRLQTIKKEIKLHRGSQHFPYIFDYY